MAPLLGDEVRVSHHPHHRRLVLAREEALPGKHVVELRDRRRAVRLRGRDDDDEEVASAVSDPTDSSRATQAPIESEMANEEIESDPPSRTNPNDGTSA